MLRGHAIECRINAEDAARRLPARTRPIATYREPAGPGVRVDSGVCAGSEIPPNYDPLVAKLIVWDADRGGRDRAHAARPRRVRDRRADDARCRSTGAAGARDSGREPRPAATCSSDADWLAACAADAVADGEPPQDTVTLDYTVEVGGRRFAVRVSGRQNGASPAAGRSPAPRPARTRAASAAGAPARRRRADAARCRAPCSRSRSRPAQQVEEGALVAIIEAMKMENEVTAHKAGVVAVAADRGRRIGRDRRRARDDRVAVTEVWLARPGRGRRRHPADRRLPRLARPRSRRRSARSPRRSRCLLADPDTEFLLARAGAGEQPCGVCQLRYRHSVWTGDARLLARGPLRRGPRAAQRRRTRARARRARARPRARRAADRARHQRAQRERDRALRVARLLERQQGPRPPDGPRPVLSGGRSRRSSRARFAACRRRCSASRRSGGSGARPGRRRAAPRGRRGPRPAAPRAVGASIGPPWPGTTCVGGVDQRLEPGERRQVGVDAARRASGSRPARGSRRRRAPGPTGSRPPCRRRCGRRRGAARARASPISQ